MQRVTLLVNGMLVVHMFTFIFDVPSFVIVDGNMWSKIVANPIV